MLRISKILLILAIVFTSCDGGVEELKYGNSTNAVIIDFKQQYGFDEIKILEMTHPNFLNQFIFECINGRDLPSNSRDETRLIHKIAHEIFDTLDESIKARAVKFHVNLTQVSKHEYKSILDHRSTRSISYKVIDGVMSQDL